MEWLAVLLGGLSLGFFGSPHCVGMCGGIISALNLSLPKDSSPARIFSLNLGYHLGRILSYMLLGFLAAWLGSQFFALEDVKPFSRWITGLSFVLAGVSLIGLFKSQHLEKIGLSIWQSMRPLRQKILPINSLPRALAAGGLWGFLPCGLVYTALALCIANATPLMGAMIMLAFGLGTTPLLLGFSSVMKRIFLTASLKRTLQVIVGAILIVIGAWTIFVKGQHQHHSSNEHQHHSESHQNSNSMTPLEMPSLQHAGH